MRSLRGVAGVIVATFALSPTSGACAAMCLKSMKYRRPSKVMAILVVSMLRKYSNRSHVKNRMIILTVLSEGVSTGSVHDESRWR